jgi:tRNA pseudouridine38-40 synthase
MRLRATIEYDGHDFAGWQRIAARRTVQGTLETALAEITGEETRVIGAGRTDAGVHAAGQVAHVDVPWAATHGAAALQRAWNARLPRDVAIHELAPAPAAFHARHSATSRAYRYELFTAPVRAPLRRRYAWHVRAPALEITAIRAAAARYVGTHDFRAFGRPTGPSGVTLRRVDRVEVEAIGDTVRFVIEANAFLRHQVRRMVGFLVDIGRGALPEAAVTQALAPGWSGPAPSKAPPQGLTLWQVNYPPESLAAEPTAGSPMGRER